MRAAHLWVVKDRAGQTLGAYRRFTVGEAVAAMLHDTAVYNSRLRGDVDRRILRLDDFRAEWVEEPIGVLGRQR